MKEEYFTVDAKTDEGCSGVETSSYLDFPWHLIKISFPQNTAWLLMHSDIPTLKEEMDRHLPLITNPTAMRKW